MKAAAALVVLALLQGFLAPSRTHGRWPAAQETALASPGLAANMASAMLGGFQPLVAQKLWIDYWSAIADGRLAEAVAALRVLSTVDAGNAEASLFLAAVLAYDLAPLEPEGGARTDRIADAVRVLEDAARRHPRDPRVPRLEGAILTAPWSFDRAAARRFEERSGQAPIARAVDACRAAAAIARDDPRARLRLGETLRRWGWEAATVGDLDAARRRMREAQEVLAALDPATAPLPRRLAAAWAALLEAWSRGETPALAAALGELAEALRAVPPPAADGTGIEEAYAWPILRPLLDLGSKAAEAEVPAVALSLLEALNTMRSLLAERLSPGTSPRVPDATWEKDLSAALELLERRDPTLGERIRKLRASRGG